MLSQKDGMCSTPQTKMLKGFSLPMRLLSCVLSRAWCCLQIRDILSTLIDVLRTPSSDVQHAVSDCLEPLMSLLASDEDFVKGLLSRVQNMLLKGASYGDR